MRQDLYNEQYAYRVTERALAATEEALAALSDLDGSERMTDYDAAARAFLRDAEQCLLDSIEQRDEQSTVTNADLEGF